MSLTPRWLRQKRYVAHSYVTCFHIPYRSILIYYQANREEEEETPTEEKIDESEDEVCLSVCICLRSYLVLCFIPHPFFNHIL